jgi:hypothetical protein
MSLDLYDVSSRWLRIVHEGFFGPRVRSPGGRFVLAWQNARPAGGPGGTPRPGRFLLLDGTTVLVRGAVRKALGGSVADTGTFLIACGPRRPGDFESTVYAVGPDGGVLLRHQIDALLCACAISPDGTIAAFQAGDGDSADVRGMLFVLDLTGRRLAWKNRPPGWASTLRVDAQAGLIEGRFRCDGGPERFRYTLGGSAASVK